MMISYFKRWVAELKEGAVDWDKMEAALIQSDLGVALAHRILEKLKKKPLSAVTVQQAVETELLALWPEPIRALELPREGAGVWLIIGVNGAGKTTSIAKLAAHFQKKGKRVFLVAADTFRAAAMDQLKIWAERLNIGIFCGKENGDPAAAVYEGLDAAQQNGAELVLVDTAGRLHNKENLMRELAKIKRVLSKKNPAYPQETLLVIDAVSGLNAVSQAKEFHQTLGVTGILATKLDSSAKGGSLAAIKAESALDTLFIGLGEQLEDWQPFDPHTYVKRFFGAEQ
ncbi:MAG: signal recognition particle-docking protein FtsY [bacterium]